jgi:spermidine synthase
MADPPGEWYDLILIDVDHSPEDRLSHANGSFYSEEGLRRAVRHLAPDGLLGVWSYSENSEFSRALRAVFREVRVEPVTFYNDLVEEETTDWLFFARL